MTVIQLPEFALVVLIGTSGAGKSSFAARHFRGTEILSSDTCRGLVADDENDQGATGDAFAVLRFIADKRLAGRRLTVVDATNIRPEDRRDWIAMARAHHALAVAIILNPGEAVCQERNRGRPDRQFGAHVVRNQTRAMKRGLGRLRREGFRQIHEFRSPEEIDAIRIDRVKLWTDRRDETGPFDIIGDVHGCGDELETLLAELGYRVHFSGSGEDRRCRVEPPPGRKLILLGDLVDRGPRIADVLRLAMTMVEQGQAMCVIGNHEAKLLKWLEGRKVKISHGLDLTIAQLEAEPPAFRDRVQDFLKGLVSHYWLDGGRMSVAHAGVKQTMMGRASGAIRGFCLYGETTGETDEFGLPVRHNWAADYRGDTKVIYGHTPVPETEWLNNTLCIDTGCVYGGRLTALRYPELEEVTVPAAQIYCEPARPLGGVDEAADRSAQQIQDDLLHYEDVSGKRILTTELRRSITVREENAMAALEVMSRHAVDPKWLIYLPPTMSPTETSREPGFLEHPDQAFAYFRGLGVNQLVCQEKHMGSRAVIVLCRDATAARRHFGVGDRETGAIYTRTGRPFFGDPDTTEAMLGRLRAAADKAGLWQSLASDWLCLDAEIMPWSAKAQALIREQYAPTATAAQLGLTATLGALRQAEANDAPVAGLRQRWEERLTRSEAYAVAYKPYCWPVISLDDYRVAPFHLLASDGAVHMDRDHLWHMATLAGLAEAGDAMVMATAHRRVALDEPETVAAARDWWLDLTETGGEGMVVKPLDFIARGQRGLIQPALKCRGRTYLRIIYGPEYDAPDHLDRLRRRGLGSKRALALKEFALGHEALSRFVKGEPLRRVHECVFAVLALESEPIDPRL